MTVLNISETLFLLRDPRRRYAIDALDDGPVELTELADRVAAIEFGNDYDSDQRKACYVSLKQTHVEALDDADVIDHRELSGVVVPGDNYDELRDVLKTIRETVGDESVEPDGGVLKTATPEKDV